MGIQKIKQDIIVFPSHQATWRDHTAKNKCNHEKIGSTIIPPTVCVIHSNAQGYTDWRNTLDIVFQHSSDKCLVDIVIDFQNIFRHNGSSNDFHIAFRIKNNTGCFNYNNNCDKDTSKNVEHTGEQLKLET